MLRVVMAVLALAWTAAFAQAALAETPKRVTVSGEIVDTWCYISEIMYGEGTAHHQCAVWCAVGGIPVSIKDANGDVFIILRIEDRDPVDNPRVVKIQSHQVTAHGDLYERDGVRYLVVTQVADDKGVVNLTHEEYGIQPFGE
ncbi:MAG: hypothetical protein QF578_10275 [Alphaproteobacteria bacterium]|jgi:hypothetical protein|nr:hypothetical protein [Alphaproteobacteria bacterium]MDP6811994.1 hypothetical protein [Alphaproteobacteria bacterium]